LEQNDQQTLKSAGKLQSIAVVVCTYDFNRYPGLQEAIDSLLRQSHKINEIIVVASGSHDLGERISNDYISQENIKVIISQKSFSATQARNVGIRSASADIIAFTDDDIVADINWAACLIETYHKMDVVAVGGKVLPIWLTGKPDHLPEELYWLVGATHESFIADRIMEMRNTFGPNMSFTRQVFETLGYFNEGLGFAERGTSYLQGEEPEFGLRMRSKLGRGIIYNPEAIVHHKVPSSKLKFRLLLHRSFYQGYSKALIQKLVPSPRFLNPEKSYLKNLFLKYFPERIKKIFVGDERLIEIKKLCVLLLSVLAAGLGFIYGHIKYITYKQ
jgi:glycosyltransferase involved in cell wall biosynthesis